MRTRDLLRDARRAGLDAGKAAAGWTYDGNTSDAWYAATLKGIEDGDPAVLDAFNLPNLSGEWADGETPSSLCESLGLDVDDKRYEWLRDEICDAWETAVSEAFWSELERVCQSHVNS